MSHRNTTNNNDYQYDHMVIGNILLHSETKLTSIQVIIHSVITTPSQTCEKPNTPRLLSNSSGIINNQRRFSCDLKNPTIVKLAHERTLSAKKLRRIHKAGWAFVKGLKSKIITINHIESKISTTNINLNNKRNQF